MAQRALVTQRCQQPPNATSSRHPVSSPTQDWGSGQVWAALCCFSWSLLVGLVGEGSKRCFLKTSLSLWAVIPGAGSECSLSSGNAPFLLLHFGEILESRCPWNTQGAAGLGALTQLKTDQGRSPAFRWVLFHVSGAAEEAWLGCAAPTAPQITRVL